MSLVVRRETPTDRPVVDAITDAAFRKAGASIAPEEVEILQRLRACDGFISSLSLVAELDGVTVGHVICTRGDLGAQRAVGLGPISVLPEHQRRRVGSALIHAVVGAADALGESIVVVLGDPAYYSRFGFVPAATLGVEAPDAAWGAHFQARPLHAWRPGAGGSFQYAEPLRGA